MKFLSTYIIVIICATNLLIAQTLKTYQGAWEQGVATYQYFENSNYERIFHGTFHYESIQQGETFTIDGNFEDNFRTGRWTFSFMQSDIGSNRRSAIFATGNYVEGAMDGVWTYSQTENGTGKIWRKSTIHFSNNIPTGDYQYESAFEYDPAHKSTILKAHFSDSGYYDGSYLHTYTFNNIPFEDRRTYKNGVLKWGLFRNMASGEILMRFDSTMQSMRPYEYGNRISRYSNDITMMDGRSSIDIFWFSGIIVNRFEKGTRFKTFDPEGEKRFQLEMQAERERLEQARVEQIERERLERETALSNGRIIRVQYDSSLADFRIKEERYFYYRDSLKEVIKLYFSNNGSISLNERIYYFKNNSQVVPISFIDSLAWKYSRLKYKKAMNTDLYYDLPLYDPPSTEREVLIAVRNLTRINNSLEQDRSACENLAQFFQEHVSSQLNSSNKGIQQDCSYQK